ncbi:hypothetical protein NQD34_014503 [Periophthalmus magnuspinnatus]|nr:hypothetical protein NQD34_014503 [Periophthalmus magnuspinnatus]
MLTLTFLSLCFAAYASSSAQQDPSSTSSQNHQKTDLHRLRHRPVNKEGEETKPGDALTGRQNHPGHILAPPVFIFVPFLVGLDKMNTSLLSSPCVLFYFFFVCLEWVR